MTTRDLTNEKLPITIVIAMLLFAISLAGTATWAWFDLKNAVSTLDAARAADKKEMMGLLVLIKEKQDEASRGNWTVTDEWFAWDMVKRDNLTFKIPDVREIHKNTHPQ